MNKLFKVLLTIIAVAMLIMFIYGMYSLERKVNYSVSYEGMVRHTITEMVKEEALR